MEPIVIKGLHQNNVKNVHLEIPKNKLVVFTGVSGSGKSSIVFDTIANESQRQMNETYPAFVRNRMPKYPQPTADSIENLNPSIIVDQSRLGGNGRSTVGTITEAYTMLRLLYARVGQPYIGSASHFSFNDPNGMCPDCSGLGKQKFIAIDHLIDKEKSWQEGAIADTTYRVGSWYWKQYANSGLFDISKPLKEYTEEEYNTLLYGHPQKETTPLHPKVAGIVTRYEQILLHRDLSDKSRHTLEKQSALVQERECPACAGKRLNKEAVAVTINGYSIADVCDMELTEMATFLSKVTDPTVETVVSKLEASIQRMIAIGLPYLHLSRETQSLSGGEAQRLKLVRYMGSSLTGMIYIFDEPSTGLHPRDVFRMSNLLLELRDKGNTVLVVEHDPDIIQLADEIIDVGPQAGEKGGKIMFQGSYEELLLTDTPTGSSLRAANPIKETPKQAKGWLSIQDATLHNLKHVSVDIPTNVLTVVTGVAGSGKSSLIGQVLPQQCPEEIVMIDQSPITATSKSMPATYLGFYDEIRQQFARASGMDKSLFSYNSKGACPACKGKGRIITELVFMDPVVTVCEACDGQRFSKESLSHKYKGKSITELLTLTAEEACIFFRDTGSRKLQEKIQLLVETGLGYLTLGQPLSTLSGGERQRLKLAKEMNKKGSIYVLDEPTTGLHLSDIDTLLQLLEKLVVQGNTVLVIEHNIEVMKQADWMIDIGPDGGTQGGKVVFQGTPQQLLTADTITAEYVRQSLKRIN